MISVIIADDSIMIRSLIRRILEKTGWVRVVAEAENGREAIRCIQHLPADLLVLDIEMPVMSGVEVLEYLHQKEIPIKVLVLSGYSDSELVRGSLEMGAMGYVLKDEAHTALPAALSSLKEDKIFVSDLLKNNFPSGRVHRPAGMLGMKPYPESSAHP